MKWTEIRKLASDPTQGVPIEIVDGPAWAAIPPSTKSRIWRMGLTPPPYGSPKQGDKVLFLREVAFAMHPESKGKALATRIRKEKGGGRFLETWGNVNGHWQWHPDIYKDENGVPNCLVIMADGFPMVRVRLGTDDQWRLDYVQRDEITRLRCGNGYDEAPDQWKEDIAFPKDMVPAFLTALGLPLDTDPVSLMGTVVTDDQILALITPREKVIVRDTIISAAPAVCTTCGEVITKGSIAVWDRDHGNNLSHLTCK